MAIIRSLTFSVVSICLLALTGVWAWGSPFSQIPSAAANAQKNQQKENADQPIVFTGTVVKDGEQFTLHDSSGTVYLLDDSERAKPFEGKPVKVTGHLGTEAKIILVENIEVISAR